MKAWHRAGLVGLLTLIVATFCVATASAHAATPTSHKDNGSPGNQPVGICHHTGNSQAHEWVYITPDASGVWDGHAKGGHQDFYGPEDIIPPFSFTDSHGDVHSFPGQNLTQTYDASLEPTNGGPFTGQQILDNQCKAPSPPPPPPTGSITLIKHLSPGSDSGLFTLKVDQTAVATNVGDGGTGTASGLAAGSYTVSEVAGTSTSLDNYNSSVSCTNESTGTVSTTVNLGAGQHVTCTFTNTRKSTPPPTTRHIYVIKLAKDASGNLIPSTPTGFFQFTLTCDGSSAKPAVTYNTTPQLVGDCPTNVGGSVSEPATQGDWVNVGSATQTFVAGNGDVTLTFINQEKPSSTPPPPGQCPEGTTPVSTNPLVCLKTVTNTVTNTVTQTVTVYGTPTCPAGSTQTSSGPGYVVCNTTTTGTCTEGTPVPGSNPVVCKVTVTKVVIKKVPVKAKPKKHPKKHHVVHKPTKPKHHAKPPKRTHYTP
jgi:hypothetical protein